MTVKRQIVYISGPYRSRWGIIGRAYNIWKARQAAIKMWQLGYTTICPHLNTAFFDGKAPDDVWLDGDLKILAKCHIIYLLKGWEQSEGAMIELTEARRRGLKVVYWHEEILKAERDKIIQAFGIPESILGIESKPIIEGDDKEGTHYFVCSKCGEPCDFYYNTHLPDKLEP